MAGTRKRLRDRWTKGLLVGAVCSLLGPQVVGRSDTVDEEETTLDIMVLYTPQVRIQESQTGVEGGVRLCIAYLNEAFRQSLMPARARFVHVGETVWHHDSGSVCDELGFLMNDPVVAELRDRYGADLVALRVLPGPGPRGMATFGGVFSVWTGSPRVFAHEIGHNLGLGHARHEAGSCTPIHPFGYGYVTVPPNGRGIACGDIMSSVSGPPLFSNPLVSYLGAPMGISDGHLNVYGMSDSADAARALLLEVPKLSKLRPTRTPRLVQPKLDRDGTIFEFVVASADEPCGIEWTSNGLDWQFLCESPASSELGRIQDFVDGVEMRTYRIWICGRLSGDQVGFLKKSLPAGMSLISNPFDNQDNTVGRLFADFPQGTVLFKWDDSARRFVSNRIWNGVWSPVGMRLNPGEGAVLWLPTPQSIHLTGTVLDAFHRSVPAGWSLQGVPFPYSGELLSRFRYPSARGALAQVDEIYLLSSHTGRYEAWESAPEGWSPSSGPNPKPGEAFWSFKSPNSHLWTGVLWPGMGGVR
jgi:hypothetical protein